MYGTLMINPAALSEQDTAAYKEAYCGLCAALGNRLTLVGRGALSYDMTFVVLLLDALSPDPLPVKDVRCPKRPLSNKKGLVGEIPDFVADMSLLLAREKGLDNWRDDKSILSLTASAAFKGAARSAEERWPDNSRDLSLSLENLYACERTGETNPDIPAGFFGDAAKAFMIMPGFEDRPSLPAFCWELGRFVYLMDAAMDLKRDLKKKRYNPLTFIPSSEHEGIMSLVMARCAEAFDKLPLLRRRALLQHIIYDGVWLNWQRRKAGRD